MAEIFFILCVALFIILAQVVRHYRKVTRYITDADDYMNRTKMAANIYYSDKVTAAEAKEKAVAEKESFVNDFLSAKIDEFPVVATVIADYETARNAYIADILELKKRPSFKGADEVRAIRAEKNALIRENKAYKWELEYIKSLLPWLSDLEDDPIEEPTNSYKNPNYKDSDVAGYWLTPEEYHLLSPTERNQLALDRYKKRHKTNAEIGREYERYIGYLYEEKGYSVTYYGIERGLEDFGRDLICKKGGRPLVIQCKCWSNKKKKIIREKHINQLYGTTIAYKISLALGIDADKIDDAPIEYIDHLDIDFNSYNVQPIFFSTVPYSTSAVLFADLLKIKLVTKPLGDYPMIKCNISSRTGEKIYHLPFDQQYDKCVITPSEGEFYASTVQEAEKAGFRRAIRWLGNN